MANKAIHKPTFAEVIAEREADQQRRTGVAKIEKVFEVQRLNSVDKSVFTNVTVVFSVGQATIQGEFSQASFANMAKGEFEAVKDTLIGKTATVILDHKTSSYVARFEISEDTNG